MICFEEQKLDQLNGFPKKEIEEREGAREATSLLNEVNEIDSLPPLPPPPSPSMRLLSPHAQLLPTMSRIALRRLSTLPSLSIMDYTLKPIHSPSPTLSLSLPHLHLGSDADLGGKSTVKAEWMRRQMSEEEGEEEEAFVRFSGTVSTAPLAGGGRGGYASMGTHILPEGTEWTSSLPPSPTAVDDAATLRSWEEERGLGALVGPQPPPPADFVGALRAGIKRLRTPAADRPPFPSPHPSLASAPTSALFPALRTYSRTGLERLNDVPLDTLEVRARIWHRRPLLISIRQWDLPQPGDIYQHVLVPHAPTTNVETPWETFHIPFSSFVLTWQGRIHEDAQVPFDGSNVERLSLVIADGNEGDYCVDLAWIRAVNGRAVQSARRYYYE